jgi:GDSL-like Lipase/Acylhydrolase
MSVCLLRPMRYLPGSLIIALLVMASPQIARAAHPGYVPNVVVIGDSISEGVQSADASWSTQLLTYFSWVIMMVGDPEILEAQPPIPLLEDSIFGRAGNPDGRPRRFPDSYNRNVAVSGAKLTDLLFSQADAASIADIDSELDLVLYPRQQSQIEYVESVAPDIVLCWIGNNDTLAAAISFAALDASQLTPVATFDLYYTQLADRLGLLSTQHGTKTVFINLPNVTDIGFLMNKVAAESLTGFTVDLGAGEFTSLVAVMLMRVAGDDDLISDPDWVLDAAEVATVQARVDAFNVIISREANRIGMPVVDLNARFSEFVANPFVINGKALQPAFLQGMFSLDGVHPNLIMHALIANEVISVMNTSFSLAVPLLSQATLEAVFELDPNIDKDGDGSATGRLGAGFIESVAWLLGFTGDTSD